MANNPQVICPNCSVPLPKNVNFCTKCGTKIEEKPDTETTQTAYQRTQTQPTNDPVESLTESGKDFMRDIGSLFNKASESNRPRQQYHPPDEPTQNYNIERKIENDEFDQLQYLEKLAELKDKGIISDEEFKKKKKDILKL